MNDIKLDAMLEEEMIDLLTYCITQDPKGTKNPEKKTRVHEIGMELFSDGGIDAMENTFFAIEQRIFEEIKRDPKSYRSWWNEITTSWKY